MSSPASRLITDLHLGESRSVPPVLERHYPISFWAELWGFSAKTVRLWFADEVCPGILRHSNSGRRKTRDYNTLMISASAAARVYEKHTAVS